MTKTFYLSVLCAAALGAQIASAQSTATESSAQVVQGAPLSAGARQAAANMLANGVGAFSVGYGQRGSVTSLVNLGGMRTEQAYPIASASKFLVAATVMSLVDEGRLSLDQHISTWLPQLNAESGRITLRQLLAQTSGLAGVQGEFYDLAQDHRITLAQSAQDIASRPLISRPGDVFAYGSGGFQLVGAVVEAATGQRWAEVFRRRVAEPLGMNHTYWTHLRLDSTEELPVAETLNPVLQGGAVSTASDYLRFLGMLAQGGLFEGRRILSAASIDALLSDQTPRAKMTPSGANVLTDAHYSLGNWCESWDAQGACQRSSSIGLFGVYPWVERETGRFGIVFPYVRDNAFRFWPEMERIRDAAPE